MRVMLEALIYLAVGAGAAYVGMLVAHAGVEQAKLVRHHEGRAAAVIQAVGMTAFALFLFAMALFALARVFGMGEG